MLKISPKQLDSIEKESPSIGSMIRNLESAVLPVCVHCGSEDTARVGYGIVRQSMTVANATTKYHLIANGPAPGQYFCNSCNEFFNPEPETTEESG